MQAGRPFQAIFSLLVLAILSGQGAPPASLGPQGVEAEPDRAQQWLVPTPAADRPAHAVLVRPPGDGPFRLAVIAHATTENVLRRAQMPQPEYRPLAAFLVARGFAVLVPERLGHGATGDDYIEDQGGCEEADYVGSARAAAGQISSALRFLRAQPFIRHDSAVILGHSAGGWGALALASENPRVISAIIAFAPGRGGHASDVQNQVCAPQRLIDAAATLGERARVGVTWLVAANDTYFSPAFSRKLADAFRDGGGSVAFRVLPASGDEGHWMAETEGGVLSAGADLDRALRLPTQARSGKR